MNTENKIGQLLTKLIRETNNGNVKWSVEDAPDALNYQTEQSVPLYLQTVYGGKALGIYDLRTKHYTDVDEYSWSEGIGFCILDEAGRVVWEISEFSPALADLFNTAREQVSGINDLINGLLDD